MRECGGEIPGLADTQQEVAMKVANLFQEHAPDSGPTLHEIKRIVSRTVEAGDSPVPPPSLPKFFRGVL